MMHINGLQNSYWAREYWMVDDITTKATRLMAALRWVQINIDCCHNPDPFLIDPSTPVGKAPGSETNLKRLL